jgi:hypothetical protein
VRGTAHARHPLRAEGGVEERRGRGAVRRDEALRQRDDPGAVRDPQPPQLLDGVADPLRRNREQDQVRALEVLALRPEERDPEVARQLDALQVALVLVRPAELIGLLAGAAQQRGADPGPLEQDGDGGAERPGPDDRRTTRMLAGVADGRGR